jgi:D-arabinose 5-phosphate isomerase GutQ
MSRVHRPMLCSDPLSDGPVLKTFERSEGLIAPSENGSWGMILAMTNSITHAVTHTCLRNQEAIEAASDLIAAWMAGHSIVRFVGCGRALLAASMPGNRMAHGGAQVSFMGGMVPLPNSRHGGGLIACSASGKTRAVLEAMQAARTSNPDLKIVGLSRYDAKGFQQLCDIFIGIHTSKSEYPNPLSALADTEEHVISGILDALAVIAGRKIHITAEGWRQGHEDIGPTGPYTAKCSQSTDLKNNGSRSSSHL